MLLLCLSLLISLLLFLSPSLSLPPSPNLPRPHPHQGLSNLQVVSVCTCEITASGAFVLAR